MAAVFEYIFENAWLRYIYGTIYTLPIDSGGPTGIE
jgi:hypothetical protein